MTFNQKGFPLIILISLMGATMGVAAKIGVQDVPPIGFVASRAVLSLIMILPLIIKTKFWRIKNKKSLFAFSTLATANITLFTLGIPDANVSVAAAIYTAVPLLTAILFWFFFQERINTKQFTGILIGLLGTVLIVLTPLLAKSSFNIGSLRGNLLISLAVLSLSFHTALSRKVQQQFSPLIITQAFIITASAILLPLALWDISINTFWPSDLYLKPILAMLYISAIGTVGFYFLYQHIIKQASPLVASLMMYIQPIFALILGIIIFQESLTPEFALGTLLAFIGVWLVTSKQKKKIIVTEAKAGG